MKRPARSIRNQGKTVNACLSCAIAAAAEGAHPDFPELSPLFHFYWSRPGQSGNRGLSILGALAGGKRYGLCRQQLHGPPYSLDGLRRRPSPAARADGRTRLMSTNRRGIQYRRLPTTDRAAAWRTALTKSRCLFFGFAPDEAYDRLSTDSPVWLAQGPRNSSIGHAAAVLGFDEQAQNFIVQDSRGPEFALGGQWFLPSTAVGSQLIEASYSVK